MDLSPVTLELPGGVARLVPMRPDHAPGLLAASDPVVWEFMTSPPPGDINDMLAWMRPALEAAAAGTAQPFVVEHVPTGRVVGSTRIFDVQPLQRSIEIGFTWLTPDCWRTPVNTQCKFLLLRHAFETLGCSRVQLKTDARNLRSRAAMERMGATREGTLRQHMILYNGHRRDTTFFSVLDDEWPAVKARLVEMLGGIGAGL